MISLDDTARLRLLMLLLLLFFRDSDHGPVATVILEVQNAHQSTRRLRQFLKLNCCY